MEKKLEEKEMKVEVYDRLENKRTISSHKTWKLAEAAAKRLGCGDRFGLREAEKK